METLKQSPPKYGDIGVCQNGYLGLVLDAVDDIAYGIHIGRLKLGNKWQSKNPKILGNIYNYISELKNEKI